MRKFPRKFRLTHSFFSQLHSGDLGALSGLLQLTIVGLQCCKEITGKEDSRTVLLGPVRAHLSANVRLTEFIFSQLHSGDLGALSGLLQLENVDLYNCEKITGSPRAPFRE